MTDESGTVIFVNVPINDYLISVEESKNFLPGEKRLDLIGERTIQPEFHQFIELKPQISSFAQIQLIDVDGRNVEGATVSALLLELSENLETDRKHSIK
jgi:hypothetical protein